MSNWFKSGNLILIGGGLMLLFIFSLFARFMAEDLTLVTKDYYSQELKYDQKKKAMSHALEIDSVFTLSQSGDSLILSIPAALSAQITTGQVHFYCPSGDKGDRFVAIDANPCGRYLMLPVLLNQCTYTVKVLFNTPYNEYYKEFKL